MDRVGRVGREDGVGGREGGGGGGGGGETGVGRDTAAEEGEIRGELILGLGAVRGAAASSSFCELLVLLQHEAHCCRSPFTSTSLSLRCLPQYEVGQVLQNTNARLLHIVQ